MCMVPLLKIEATTPTIVYHIEIEGSQFKSLTNALICKRVGSRTDKYPETQVQIGLLHQTVTMYPCSDFDPSVLIL